MNPATAVAVRVVERWQLEKATLDEMIAYAFRTKTNLPDNYWQEEHHARLRALVAVKLDEAFNL